ncbi:hypothetical protein COU79_01135 [Candidatus Peregrinibacteria bacterium CG10_big_fil_rev_8_21_14_0_10_54_7]|nr:MAG: hypothetical protein COU79_01135 [Candidatus Peregrinibacteria bacterium CG10_big_fil_rev_8_21_14_0_10_54_7]
MPWFYARLAAALMLLWAIAPNPYPYYMFLRVVVCGVGAYSAHKAYELKKTEWTWAFVLTAVLFNPFIPAHLTKEIWMLFNLIGSILLFASLRVFGKKIS